MCKLRSFVGKNLVAFLRESDYAHAGEEDAIVMSLHNVAKNKEQLVLDVGCGLGGTAQFIQQHGWGKVVGIDIEAEAIEYANKKYPEIEFYQSDVVNVPEVIKDKKFDLICMFNAFYAFSDHLTALKALRKVARENAKIIIFDYMDFSDGKCSFIKEAFVSPIHPENTRKTLQTAGWDGIKLEDITPYYIKWYKNLLAKLAKNKDGAIERYGKEYYTYAWTRYNDFVKNFEAGNIGGAIVYADAV